MPLQLQRILLLFLAFILIFLVIRFFVVPDSFGEYGHYRGASLEANANMEPKYIDQEKCGNCHAEIAEQITYSSHYMVSCQTCHGPGYEHQDTLLNVAMNVPRTRKFCGTCHQTLPGRPSDWVNQVDLKAHNTKQNCIECHNPHEPWLDL